MDLQAVWEMHRKGDIKGLVEAAWRQTGSVRKEAVTKLNIFYRSPQRGEVDAQITAEAVKVLIAALSDDHPGTCKEASQALGNIGDAKAVAALVDVLESPNWENRYFAAKALGEIGDASAIPALEAAQKDGYTETFYDWNNVRRKVWPVRTAASDSLIKINIKE